MATFYLAASFTRIEDARSIRDQIIRAFGGIPTSSNERNQGLVQCTSSWLGKDRENKQYGKEQRFATSDVVDVTKADFMVQLVGDAGTRGGRHTELGLAIALEKPILLLGGNPDDREQVFHYHPLVSQYQTMNELVAAIGILVKYIGQD